MTQKFPPPWALKGTGFMIFYRFKSDFSAALSGISDDLKASYKAGIGCMMLVNYEVSNCGPYQELLLISGKFDFGGKYYYSISDIFVSTQVSVDNGRENWGIPKFIADFEWVKHSDKEEHIRVRKDGKNILEIDLSFGGLKMPITTSLIPLSVVQEYDGKKILTSPKSKGFGQLAKMKRININADLFPDLSTMKPLAVLKVSDFKLTFPIPTLLNI